MDKQHHIDDDLPALTGKHAGWLLVLILSISALLSVIIPPTKSPDEADHLRRAYFLSQGVWGLKTDTCAEEGAWCRNGRTMSGGDLDTGLHEYLILYDVVRHQKEGRLEDEQGRRLGWKGQKVFVPAPGTGFYFPLIYVPQAVGLGIGKLMGLSILHSYYLARGMTVLAGGLVLVLAFSIYLPPPVVCALLLVPMSLFQMASASIDFLSTALAMLVMCCFVRISQQRTSADNGLFWLMAVSIFIVATCRAHLAAMVLLLFASAWLARRAWVWWLAAAVTVLILVWTGMAIGSTVDFRTGREATAGQVAMYYVSQPQALLDVFVSTFQNVPLRNFYAVSFLGIFADRALEASQYRWVATLLGGVLLMSLFPLPKWRERGLTRSALLLAGLSAVILAFLAMLVAWSPHPAQVIEGVQGRYLLVPVMLLLTGMCSWDWRTGVDSLLRLAFVGMLGVVALLISVRMLLGFFYTPLMSVGVSPVRVESAPGAQPSPALSAKSPVTVRFPSVSNVEGQAPVRGLGMLTATYGRALSGQAILMLVDAEGRHVRGPLIDLGRVQNNDYFYVPVPAGRWVSAELQLVSGEGGVSVWETVPLEGGDSPAVSCMVTIHEDNAVRYVQGCPVPR